MTDGARLDVPGQVSVVIATRDRRDELLRTLDHLAALPERPDVVVVDNGSSDGSPAAVARAFPTAQVVALDRNVGAAARNIGARVADTTYVAFADDDSWWAPGALGRALEHFARSPRMAVLQARILVGAEERLDPVCDVMARSPLPPAPDLPGPTLLGFVACGAIVHREAFLSVGGFDDLLFFLGEEQLVAQDLTSAGWGLAYVADVVAHHHPSPVRDPVGRRRREARNDLLATWMRRPWAVVVRSTAAALATSVRDAQVRSAVAEAAIRLPGALRRRRRLPADVERQLTVLARDVDPPHHAA